MPINLVWLGIIVIIIVFALNFVFNYQLIFRLTDRQKNLIKTGVPIKAQYKEVKYQQNVKWNRYQIITVWTNPAEQKVYEFASDWIRGMAPKNMASEFKVYVNPDNYTDYYMEITELKKRSLNPLN